MKSILQINVTANWGSHGKIAEAIGSLAIDKGWKSMIAYGRGTPNSRSQLLRIGNDLDMRIHGLETRLLDRHGLASANSTRNFIKRAIEFNPDIIHIHNIHGYYLNYPILFDWLKCLNKPVIWTLHDCWPWTGHCAYYTFSQCNKWQTQCKLCPSLSSYPKSIYDGSLRNFETKKEAFLGVNNMTLVAVSNWISEELKNSFLMDYPTKVIHNGIDVSVFKPSSVKPPLRDTKVILGVASVWDKRKGFEEFIKLHTLLDTKYHIILVGLSNKQISALPDGISGIQRTESANQLADLYSMADVFVNPTFEDNFPTTNIEALACGTPVITYNTGGAPEAIDANTGIIVERGDVDGLASAIMKITKDTNKYTSEQCRNRALTCFDKDICFKKYFDLYYSLLR